MSTPEYVCKLLIKQREEQMNTIQITTADGTVNYTESEVVRFIERAKEVDAVQQVSDMQRKEKVDNRNKVRDFFSEGEWNDGETVVSKGDVNELLESIGANKLTTRYNASYTITGTFTVEVEDEDDVESLFADNVDVSFHDGDIDVDQIDVNDIEVAE
jgi:hypothetical protein